jgi:uncharacterized membrane protein
MRTQIPSGSFSGEANVTVFDPPGGQSSVAQDINKKGVVVGEWLDGGAARHG